MYRIPLLLPLIFYIQQLNGEQLKKTKEIQQWFLNDKIDASSKLPGTNMNRTDLASLNWFPSEWLTDEVVNAYMTLLCNRYGNIHALSTHLLPSLKKWGYGDSARHHTKRVDIFSKEYVFVPLNWRLGGGDGVANHWSLVVFDIPKKKIKMYDSLGQHNMDEMEMLSTYLEMESYEKRKVRLDIHNWRLVKVTNAPKQENSTDCGVFTCQYAQCVAKNEQPTFSQQHTTYFRQKMLYEITSGKLLE